MSIEGGDAIKDIFWVETTENATSFDVEVTADMSPNVYLYVSLIQPYGQTENDAPLRLYGVVPVLVENPKTILNPKISMKDEIEPEQEYEIEVSEKDGREMTYTLAIVDEGLLGLTNFKTPNPHSSFYAREALGVLTWDMFDFVAGAYGARLEKAFAVGGDENLNDESKKKVNRFKPVVEFAGPFTLKKRREEKTSFYHAQLCWGSKSHGCCRQQRRIRKCRKRGKSSQRIDVASYLTACTWTRRNMYIAG